MTYDDLLTEFNYSSALPLMIDGKFAFVKFSSSNLIKHYKTVESNHFQSKYL